MKILFLAPANSVHTVKWVNALQKRGNEVCLVSLAEHGAVETLEQGIITRYLKINGKKGYYANAAALRKIEKEFAPDVINAHYASGYGTLMRISRLPRKKCILSVWGDDVYGFPYRNKISYLIIKKNLAFAPHIASTSHCMKKQVKRLLNKDKEIAVTPFGVDTTVFYGKTRSSGSDQFVFGSMKSLEYQYGIDILIKAFAEFLCDLDENEQNRVRLKRYGKGPLLAKMSLLAEELKIKEQVEFCGFISNASVSEALCEIDVLCLTSVIDSESFGVAAVEAMACEVPVIVSDVEGYKEVVVSEKTGLIIPRNDVGAVCKAMKKIYHDPALRNYFGKNGRSWVKENYEWDHCVQIMMDLYCKVCQDNI